MEAPRFRVTIAKVNPCFRQQSNNVPEESSCIFRDFLVHHTEHPENPSSHVYVPDKERTSVKAKKYYAQRAAFYKSCMDYMLPGFSFSHQTVISGDLISHIAGLPNTQKTYIWGTEPQREIQKHKPESRENDSPGCNARK